MNKAQQVLPFEVGDVSVTAQAQEDYQPVSAISFGDVTIMKRLGSQDAKVVKLELGYPSSSFYGGEDHGLARR